MFEVVFTYDYDQSQTAMMTEEQLREFLAEPFEEDEGYDVYAEDGTYLWDEDLIALGVLETPHYM